MSKYSKVTIAGITIKDDSSLTDPKKLFKWDYEEDEAQPISEATIECPRNIIDLVTLQNNQIVEIYDSPDNVTFTRIFYGYIDTFEPEGATITIKCKNKMYDLVRRNVNTIYDASISPSAGQISAIAVDLIETYGELTADAQASGTAEGETISEFKCINTDIYERVKALQESLGWTIYYDSVNDTVHFEPRGFEDSGITLITSDNIIGIPKWSIDTSQMINRLRVDGATTSTQITETGRIGVTTGYTTTSITLEKTPDSVEVFMDASNPPTTQLEGGSKDGSTGNDYWVDRENKKIMPATGTTFTTNHYAIVNYFWSAPAPIEMENPESIDNYGLFEKQISLNDITSIADAESRATSILSRRSVPFYVGEFQVKSSVRLKIGQLVSVQDNITPNAPNGNYMVSKVKYNYPSAFNEITVGDKVWRMVDWEETTDNRIKRLEEQFVRNQDLLRKLVQINQSVTENFISPTPRYFKTLFQSVAGDSLIWGNPDFGIWGSFKWGGSANTSFILGHSIAGILGVSKLGSQASVETLHFLQQYEDYMKRLFLTLTSKTRPKQVQLGAGHCNSLLDKSRNHLT